MKKTLIYFFITACIVYSVFLAGCSGKHEIVLDDSDPLALATDIEWAVITEPYVAFRTEPGYDKTVMNYGRIGEIVMVLGKRYDSSSDSEITWYDFDKGWLDQTSIVVYDNKLKAKSASDNLLEKQNGK